MAAQAIHRGVGWPPPKTRVSIFPELQLAMIRRPIATAFDRVPADDHSTTWSARYGECHRLQRVVDFPRGVTLPQRVRLYSRRDHFVLQWWDPAAKKNLSERVDGDLIDAMARARKLDERLDNFKTSGQGIRKLTHSDLADAYVADLQRRADAGELAPATVERYAAALAHYRAFASEPANQKTFPYATGANREFQLAFAAHLEQRPVAAQGQRQACRRPLRSPQMVLDTVRAMYAWAANPALGNRLPAGFQNPFSQSGQRHRRPARDPFGPPDISTAMAVALLGACDAYQLPLFATLVLFGLRAAEPVYLFQEQISGEWLKVTCLPELGYLTKGRRDKRFPIPPRLQHIWSPAGPTGQGLLFTRRGTDDCGSDVPLYGASYAELSVQFQRRCQAAPTASAAARQSIRDQVIRDAGGLNYDQLEHEFQGLVPRRFSSPGHAERPAAPVLDQPGELRRSGILPPLPHGSIAWQGTDRHLHPPEPASGPIPKNPHPRHGPADRCHRAAGACELALPAFARTEP